MEKRKSIVHLTTVHHPYDPRIYYKQCMSLQNNGFDVTLIGQAASDETGNKEEPIKHLPLKKYSSRFKRMIFGTLDAYKKAKAQKADIYVFHDPELIIVGALLKKKNNIVIYDIHEDYITSILQKEYLSNFLKKFFAKAYRLVEKIFTRKMALSLAEKYYQEIYPQGVCILNYPLMNEEFIENNRNARPISNRLLYTGNVKADRGALLHAKIPKIFPDIEVQFVGKCAPSVAEEIYTEAGSARDKVAIMGIDEFIEKPDMENMYLQENWLAGIALFPPTDHYMKKELTKFFEYMNVGLPIICSNFPKWQEFIDKYECGIAVDPYDDEAIAAAIKKIQNNKALAVQMSQNGKSAIVNELNWQIEEEKLINWYKQLLAEIKK